MIVYQKEKWSDVLGEMKEIFPIQWEEVGLNAVSTHGIPLNPNWEAYKVIEEKGGLYVFTARTATGGNLVGHCSFLVFTHLHSKDVLVAENDFLYLLKEYRKGFVGVKLIKFAVEELKKVVDVVCFNVDMQISFLPILKRLGFKTVECRALLEV
jgi:GNAT superfamily N-acetyltransferase